MHLQLGIAVYQFVHDATLFAEDVRYRECLRRSFDKGSVKKIYKDEHQLLSRFGIISLTHHAEMKVLLALAYAQYLTQETRPIDIELVGAQLCCVHCKQLAMACCLPVRIVERDANGGPQPWVNNAWVSWHSSSAALQESAVAGLRMLQ